MINQIFNRSQMKGISSHRKYNPTKSTILLSLYALLSCIMKVAGTILFFQATLGLHDSLRHLQGSQAASLWKNEKPFQFCKHSFYYSIKLLTLFKSMLWQIHSCTLNRLRQRYSSFYSWKINSWKNNQSESQTHDWQHFLSRLLH